ncbi:MAG: hypothetical protein J6C33_08775 [Lachnospiraceae bacterium]|nr:hypothetical protein [Lachnospiraceae bacterium]
MQETVNMIRQKIDEAELVLVGIGEKFSVFEQKELKSEDENRQKPIERAYQNLARFLEGKNYFVITTCVDDLICHAGLKQDRIVRPLAEAEKGAAVENGDGAERGAPAESGEGEAKGQEKPSAWETYLKWLQGTLHKKLLVLELGVGLKYPAVIRFPFEKTVYFNQSADFIRVHDKLFQLPAELNGRGISVKADAPLLLAEAEI